MSVDFPRAWEIARDVPMEMHINNCSFRMTNGALLCDCYVLYNHLEYNSKLLYTAHGLVYNEESNLMNQITIMRASEKKLVGEFSQYKRDVEELTNNLRAENERLTYERDEARKEISWLRSGAGQTEIGAEVVRAERDRYKAALIECNEFLKNAPFDFRNGNESNGIDEGEVLGTNYLFELIKMNDETLAESEPK